MLNNQEKKLCNTCKKNKAYDMFYKNKNSKDGLHSQCKECRSKWLVDNKKHIAEYSKKYKEEHKDEIRKYSSYYNKTMKHKICKKNNKHRRRDLAKNSTITNNQLLELQQNAKVCYWCNDPLKNKNVHIDHYVPLAKGGNHTLENLVISCQKCNAKKHTKDPIEFANSIGKLL